LRKNTRSGLCPDPLGPTGPRPGSAKRSDAKGFAFGGVQGGAHGLPFIPYRTAPLEFFRSLLT
jgi:hypothetical protein